MQSQFTILRRTNVERSLTTFGMRLDDWSGMEWGAACSGELGEALNIAKKMKRGFESDGDYRQLKRKLADEMADVVIYLDLWAASEGISLEEAVMCKFNHDSTKRGSRMKLEW